MQYVRAFVCFFCLFFVIGYFEGRNHVITDDEIFTLVLPKLQLARENNTIAILFINTKSPKLAWIYDTKLQKGTFYNDPTDVDLAGTHLFNIPLPSELTTMLVTGVSSWTLKDLLEIADKDKSLNAKGITRWKVFVSTIGAVTGYGVGYWVGNTSASWQDIQNIKTYLEDKSKVERLKKTFLAFTYKKVAGTFITNMKISEANNFKNSDQILASAALVEAFQERLISPDTTLTFQDFDLALKSINE